MFYFLFPQRSFFLQADVDNDIALLTQKNEEISEVVSKLEANSDNLDIDEAVVTTAPLYNQYVCLCLIKMPLYVVGRLYIHAIDVL